MKKQILIFGWVCAILISGCKPISRPSDAQSIRLPSDASSQDKLAEGCPIVDKPEITLDFDAEWQEGESRTIELIRSREDIGIQSKDPVRKSLTEVTVSVIERADKYFVLEWIYGESEILAPDTITDKTINELLELPVGLRIEYETDRWGSYRRLRNLEEVQEFVDQMFNILIEQVEKTEGQASADNLRRAIKQLSGNAQQVEALYTRDIQLFHSLWGFHFDNSDQISFEGSFPNILGGDPIPNQAVIQLIRYDAELDCASVEWTTKIDKEKARESIIQGLQRQSKQLGIDPPAGDEFPTDFDFSDLIKIDMDLATTWPTTVFFERIIKVGQGQRIDQTTVNLKQ